MSDKEEIKATGMVLTGILASEAIDSSAEVIDIKGMDITTLEEGKGFANWEHAEADNGQEIVGKIIYSRKIFKESDCLDDDQRKFWNRVKLPFLYGAVRLYDGAGHDGAKSIAAIIRDAVANNEPLEVGFSIEGATLKREGYRLKETIAKLVAITLKPCNKTAVADLMYDPHAPEGFDKNPNNKKVIYKTENPLQSRLGGSTLIYDPDMLKALSAGSYNAPPGTLTGGAALQREDKTLKSVAQAAQRDWPKTGKFRDYLKKYLEKADLGEVSDDFLDHFSDMVESKYWRVKKAEEVIENLKKAGKKPAAVKAPETPPAPELPKVPKGTLTNQGLAVAPNKKLVDPAFDEKQGVLHMPEGSFKIYIPSRDPNPEMGKAFHGIMNDPKVEEFHGYAMENWAKAHQLLKAGKLPPEVSMHAVLFSNLSPNTPVPMQEMMYGHLVDNMKETGKTPLDEGFADTKQSWLDRDNPSKFPDHSPEHWKRLESSLRLKNDSKKSGRVEGQIGSFMLGESKFKNMSKYKAMHAPLQELLQRTKGDVRAAANEMMFHKQHQIKWNARRHAMLQNKQPDIGEYQGMSIAGLAPKTARYALAMMGGGNIHVPDTHFVRNLFGLNRDLDGSSIERIKKVMWNPRNSHILEGVDRYYAKNHDAVQHMLQHPKWGKLFQNPEDAIFPAFWKHWMGIVPHEQMRGHDVNGYNELTDHKPFWQAIGHYLNKSEAEGSNEHVAMQTAKQHAEWQLQYGEIPAMMLYYRHLLPRLLASAAPRQAQELVRKVEAFTIEVLAKDTGTATPDGPIKAPELEGPVVSFQNRRMQTGKAIDTNTGSGYHLLGADATHFYGLPDTHDLQGGWGDQDLLKIKRTNNIDVQAYPRSVDTPSVVNADLHGHPEYVKMPHQRAMAHGFNFETKSDKEANRGAFRNQSFWSKDPSGNHVYVKASVSPSELRSVEDTAHVAEYTEGEGPTNSARREGIYHNLAHEFFGLGHMVPPVAVVRHPQTGREHAIIGHVAGKHIDDLPQREEAEIYNHLKNTGDLDKAHIMNFLLENQDRHEGNYMLDPETKSLRLIDHNIWGQGGYGIPAYVYHAHDANAGRGMTKEAYDWLSKLDHNNFRDQLTKHGLPQRAIDRMVSKLINLKSVAQPDKDTSFAISRSRW